MFPKGKLLALLAVFAAITLITASGAFTTVQADRTATVSITGDSAALLAIDGAANGPAGDVVSEGTNAEATIDLTGAIGQGAQGINPNSTTELSPLVNITNQGNETVNLNVSATGTNNSQVSATVINASGGGEFTARDLGSGNQTQFGLRLNATGESTATAFNVQINITADSSQTSP